MTRTVFLGTPEFAVPSLEAVDRLCDRGSLELTAVVTQPDRAGDRGRLLDGGGGNDLGARELRERLAGGGEVAGPVAEVAAERHVRAFGGGDHRQVSTTKCFAMR